MKNDEEVSTEEICNEELSLVKSGFLWLAIGVVLIFIGLVFDNGFGFFLALVGGITVIVSHIDYNKKEQVLKDIKDKRSKDNEMKINAAIKNAYRHKVSFAIREHSDTLVTKCNQTVYYDDYGNCILDAWQHEIEYFFKNVIFDDSYVVTHDDYLCFNEFFEPYLNKLKNNLITEEVKSGVDYEKYCYQKLLNAGFNVRKTNATGDQGVDLIVEENKKKCAIQCKYYSKAVGNKAVQEIIAGQSFYDCEFGMVCSNNTYTKSARQLANKQNIILASENDIVDVLNNLFGLNKRDIEDIRYNTEIGIVEELDEETEKILEVQIHNTKVFIEYLNEEMEKEKDDILKGSYIPSLKELEEELKTFLRYKI